VKLLYLTIVLAPLLAAVIAGLFGKVVGRAGAHTVTIFGVAVACGLSCYVLLQQVGGAAVFNESLYTWMVVDGVRMEIGFLVDPLTALMMVVVTFVSLMVHIYTIGYMHDDPGYQRFFSYISLFTFAMLMLVMSNNFLQLFFGWEAVGVVSYLLIGFWYTKPTAIFANMKAFLVNRVGDFGFLLGIATVLYFTGSLDYATVFLQADNIAAQSLEIIPGSAWSAMSDSCSGLPRFCILPAVSITPRCSCRPIISRRSHWKLSPAVPGRRCRWPAFCCLSVPWVSRRRCRCMSGCPTRWKARHRYRH